MELADILDLVFFGGLLFFGLWELVRPARRSAGSLGWKVRGAVAFALYLGVAIHAPFLWEERVAAHRVVDLSGQAWWVQGILAFLSAELVMYAWHRALHQVPALWRIHQTHHSAEEVDLWGAFYFHPLGMLAWTFTGSLALGFSSVTELGPLRRIPVHFVGTLSLSLREAPGILESLSHLQSIGGSLALVENFTLDSFSGLRNLRHIGGSLVLTENRRAKNFNGLQSLETIGGGVSISSDRTLASLQGLEKIREIGGSFLVVRTESLTDFSGGERLERIGGNFIVEFNKNLRTLRHLENLHELSGSIRILANPLLGSLLLDGRQAFFQIGENYGPKSLDLIFFQNSPHGGIGEPFPISVQARNPEIGQRFLGQRLGQISLKGGRRNRGFRGGGLSGARKGGEAEEEDGEKVFQGHGFGRFGVAILYGWRPLLAGETADKLPPP